MIMGRVTVSLWLIVKTFQKVPILTNASGTANMAKVVPEEKLGAMGLCKLMTGRGLMGTQRLVC